MCFLSIFKYCLRPREHFWQTNKQTKNHNCFEFSKICLRRQSYIMFIIKTVLQLNEPERGLELHIIGLGY